MSKTNQIWVTCLLHVSPITHTKEKPPPRYLCDFPPPPPPQKAIFDKLVQNLIFDGKISKDIVKDVLEKDLSVFAATNLIKQEIKKE